MTTDSERNAGDALNVMYSIVELPALRIAGLRGSLANPAEVWGRLGSTAGEAMGQPGVSTLAVFASDVVRGTAAEPAPYDAALALPDGMPAPEGLTESSVPAGRYAQCTYIGSYTRLAESWQQFTAGSANRATRSTTVSASSGTATSTAPCPRTSCGRTSTSRWHSALAPFGFRRRLSQPTSRASFCPRLPSPLSPSRLSLPPSPGSAGEGWGEGDCLVLQD